MAKSRQMYDVTIRTDVASLHTILKVVEDSAILIGVAPVTPGSPEVKESRKRTGYVDGKRNKGISATALIINALKGGNRTKEQLQTLFVENKFAASSVSPAMSGLRAEGRVRMLADGNWEFVK